MFTFIFFISALLLILGVCCVFSDYIIWHIPFIAHYIDSLGDYEDDNDEC